MSTAAERKRIQRAKARKDGLCSCCCYRKARKGRAYCTECAEATRARAARTRNAKAAARRERTAANPQAVEGPTNGTESTADARARQRTD